MNSPVMILSNGRSMFKNSIHLPVNGSLPFNEAKFAEIMSDKATLDRLRELFGVV